MLSLFVVVYEQAEVSSHVCVCVFRLLYQLLLPFLPLCTYNTEHTKGTRSCMIKHLLLKWLQINCCKAVCVEAVVLTGFHLMEDSAGMVPMARRVDGRMEEEADCWLR